MFKTFITPPSGVSLVLDRGTPGDSGYFSRTDSCSQSDYCDDMESDIIGAETVLASEGLRMQPLEHCESNRQLTHSSMTNRFIKVSRLESRTAI